MKSIPTSWRRVALLVAAAAACSSESQSAQDIATGPHATADEAEAPRAVASPNLPFEKLLQLPAASSQPPAEPDIHEVLNRKPFVGPPDPNETAQERRLRLEVEARTEAPIERHDVKREQVDAAAELDVLEDTSIRGGVRVERDSSGSKSKNIGTTPSIGIEKRF
jgi:hypothetical protein